MAPCWNELPNNISLTVREFQALLTVAIGGLVTTSSSRRERNLLIVVAAIEKLSDNSNFSMPLSLRM